MQTRSENKGIEPGVLDHSAAGHVRKGEAYGQAALRELEEELGIELGIESDLGFVGKAVQDTTHKNGLIDRQIFSIFACSHEGDVNIDKNELKSMELLLPEKIESMIIRNPSDFANGFLKTFPVFMEWFEKR